MEPALEEHRFPCPQCGGDLRFAPGEGRLLCDHCGHEEPLADTGRGHQPIPETDFRRGVEMALPDSEVQLARFSRCPNCGAEVEFDPDLHAAECPFCATPVVTDTGESRHIKPRGVAPFRLTETEAREAMTRWLGKLWFAPSGLVDYARKGRALQGVYVPYWTFDADTRSAYRGQRGTVYYETRQVRVRDQRGGSRIETRQVARIRWTPVAGRVARFFDDVLVLASRALPEGHTDALEPWDLSQLEPYAPEYLAGFRAEGYTISLQDGMTEARAQMDRMIERDVRFDIGGDRQQIEGIDTQVSGVTFKHILLPVWTAAYRYRGRSFRFVVNGQTGRVQGERPWSAVKIVVAALLGLALAAAVAYGLQQANQQGLIDFRSY
ncbi:MAG: primosomal protein N' (replication factor Y) - superfamily II helicase [Defluviimonas sp.]|uniref:TFIIB-type zinc finger domain-containing protein n=1 Tax=Albidovulum sp. TaxID=1872424 RepID=UPI001DBE3632|nr:primosomal protein N' (replication factor Y) - superfamily II helicase [Paracoccaceae bacterium]MCC0063806.1 primosomal protein N' (replication factor Y) - superfamily II helicase [Defluviimonas sp.]